MAFLSENTLDIDLKRTINHRIKQLDGGVVGVYITTCRKAFLLVKQVLTEADTIRGYNLCGYLDGEDNPVLEAYSPKEEYPFLMIHQFLWKYETGPCYLEAGDFVYYCDTYELSTLEYYQVISRKGDFSVSLRKVNHLVEMDNTGQPVFRPLKNVFLSRPVMRKVKGSLVMLKDKCYAPAYHYDWTTNINWEGLVALQAENHMESMLVSSQGELNRDEWSQMCRDFAEEARATGEQYFDMVQCALWDFEVPEEQVDEAVLIARNMA